MKDVGKVLKEVYYAFCRSIRKLPDGPTFEVLFNGKELDYVFWTYLRRYEHKGSLRMTKEELRCFIDVHLLLGRNFTLRFAVYNEYRGQREVDQGLHDRLTYTFSDLLCSYFRFLLSDYKRSLFAESCILRELASTVAKLHNN